MSTVETDLLLPPLLFLIRPGIEGGFDVEQELYEEDVKVVILPDRQEVTSEDLGTMPDVVRERVRCLVCFLIIILLRVCQDCHNVIPYNIGMTQYISRCHNIKKQL